MKKKIIVPISLIAIIFLLVFLMTGSPLVACHNYELKKSVLSVSGETQVTLNEIVPFDWDIVYTFSPYTSRNEIEKIIGFSSHSIRETVNEGMVQLLFVKGDSVVASVCGYADNLGYRITFKDSVRFEEKAVFAVDTNAGIVTLVKH